MNGNSKTSHRSPAGRRRGRTLLIWLLVFLFLDICTTIVGLSVGFRELNPLVASMMRLVGLHGLLLTKIAAAALAGYFLYSGRLLLLRRVTVLMGLVVAWNFFWLMTHSG